MKNRSLVRKDFKEGHLLLGETGPPGPVRAGGADGRAGQPGAAGRTVRMARTAQRELTATDGADADGADGADGAPGATNVVIRHGTDANIQNSTVITTSVDCIAGERAVGGGERTTLRPVFI